MRDRLVDFIICGVQKGGTTALFEYLEREPDLSMSRVKEVHFFDDESQDWTRPDYAAYHANFDATKDGLWGEATPIYSYWPNSLERIRVYNPAIKLILILRDPVQRAWSHWRMEYARGAETHPFAWCIREGRQRLFDGPADPMRPWGHHREFSYVERGFYGEQVERLYRLFPREQVLVLTAESLRADPAQTLARIRTHLDLAPSPAPAPLEAHVGREAGFPSDLTADDIAWLRRLYADDAAKLEGLCGVRYA